MAAANADDAKREVTQLVDGQATAMTELLLDPEALGRLGDEVNEAVALVRSVVEKLDSPHARVSTVAAYMHQGIARLGLDPIGGAAYLMELNKYLAEVLGADGDVQKPCTKGCRPGDDSDGEE